MTIDEELGALSPSSAELMVLAERFLEAGEFHEAIAIYDRIVACGATGYVHAKRGFAKFEVGDFRGAIADFDAALLLKPASPVTLRYRGAAKESLNDLEGAVQDYRDALAFGDRAETRCDIALILEYQGKRESAVSEFEAALRLDPDNQLARRSLEKLLSE